MTYPLVQLVVSPDDSAEVRFDFNADEFAWAAHDGFSLGSPPMLGDPGGVGADYGYRTLSFLLVIRADEPRALTLQSRLARELMRDTHWLKFQLSPTAPAQWFEVVRSSPGDVSLEMVRKDYEENEWRLAVSLVAKPFSVGAEVRMDVSLSNVAASGGIARALTNILGDAPTPVSVQFAADDGTGPLATDRWAPFLSIAPVSKWSGLEWFPASSGTLVAQTGLTTRSETNGDRTWLTSATSGLRPVLRWTIAPKQAGRYRVFLRTQKWLGTGPVRFQARMVDADGDALVTRTSVALSGEADTFGGQAWRNVDLGEFAFPYGMTPDSASYTLTSSAAYRLELLMSVDPTSGIQSQVSASEIVLVPVELFESVGPATSLRLNFHIRSSSQLTVLDSERRTLVTKTAAGAIVGTSELTADGSFPMLTPGAINVLHFLRFAGTGQFGKYAGSGGDNLTATMTATLRYRPRYLYLAGT